MLLYLHGFNSSPLSLKANIMQAYCQQCRPDIKLMIPQLPCFPADAAKYLSLLVQQYSSDYNIGLVGSSLGGYLSTWLNLKYGLRAVVVNPAVRPYELLSDFLGPQYNPYTHENYVLESKHIHELKLLEVDSLLSPQDFWVLLQTDDEVLDYNQAVSKYAKSKLTVEQGGDHSFIDFERYPQRIIEFLQL
ncbi:esterase YqiA [Vibrio sp. S17_S38]|nr:esterase YqiA [Vibrio sp. S17_S38]MBD1574205.1 esterase YqiA [Vibrio sp. S17_S38]